MAFAQSPYYTDPALTQTAGALATALFGNPQLRQQAALAQAEMDQRQAAADEARAHGGLYHSQAAGQDIENTANRGLPATIAALYAPPPQSDLVPPPNDLLAPADAVRTVPVPASVVAPDAAPQDPQAIFKAGLPAVIASLTQGGHAADADTLVRTMAAFAGGDELARRGLIAGGASPSKDFAITPERADDIRDQGFDADYRKATGVADINAGARRYAADQSLKGTEYSADASAGARRYAADQSAGASRYQTNAHYGTNDLASVITGMYPGARITSGERTQAEQDALIASGATSAKHSYHVEGNGGEAIDMAPIPGKSLGEVVAGLRGEGYQVLEALNETGHGPNQGTGAHWHIAIATPQDRGGGKASPKFSAASNKVLEESVANAMGAQSSTNPAGQTVSAWNSLDMNGPSKQRLLARAQELTMGGLPPAQAAIQASKEYVAAIKQNGGKLLPRKPGEPFRAAPVSGAPAGPVGDMAHAKVLTRVPPHARRAPDGNLYALGTDGKYYRIEEQ